MFLHKPNLILFSLFQQDKHWLVNIAETLIMIIIQFIFKRRFISLFCLLSLCNFPEIFKDYFRETQKMGILSLGLFQGTDYEG